MKIFNVFFILLLGYSYTFSQVALHLEARNNNQSQLRLESNVGGELFDFRMNNDGSLRILANSINEVLEISDEYLSVGIGIAAPGFITLRAYNNDITNDPKTGIQGDAQGSGSGSRFGVFGAAGGNSGNRYGVYGISSTGTGRWGMYCSGNFYHTGSFTSTSDGRLKSNIHGIDNGLELVMNLKPRRYQFKQNIEGLKLSKGPQIGFVAQELEKAIPELVVTSLHDIIENPDEATHKQMEIKGINYLGLIPILTKAIQEQQEMIKTLEKRIEILENDK